MIMSFWPTSLRVEENKKKKGVSEYEAEQGERGKQGEKMSPEQDKRRTNKCIPFRETR